MAHKAMITLLDTENPPKKVRQLNGASLFFETRHPIFSESFFSSTDCQHHPLPQHG